MASTDKKSRRNALLSAALFFSFVSIGVAMLLAGHNADVHHTFIPSPSTEDGRTMMDPWQAYAASLVSFAAAAYVLVNGFRKRKDDPPPP